MSQSDRGKKRLSMKQKLRIAEAKAKYYESTMISSATNTKMMIKALKKELSEIRGLLK